VLFLLFAYIGVAYMDAGKGVSRDAVAFICGQNALSFRFYLYFVRISQPLTHHSQGAIDQRLFINPPVAGNATGHTA